MKSLVQAAPSVTAFPSFNRLPKRARRKIQKLRQIAAAEIDRLLAFLDQTEGDADFEPLLAAPERHPSPWPGYYDRTHDQTKWGSGSRDDREQTFGNDDDREADPADPGENESLDEDSDGEPSLGSSHQPDQTVWGCGAPSSFDGCDLEDGDDPREIDEDIEPNLGWTEECADPGDNSSCDREMPDHALTKQDKKIRATLKRKSYRSGIEKAGIVKPLERPETVRVRGGGLVTIVAHVQ